MHKFKTLALFMLIFSPITIWCQCNFLQNVVNVGSNPTSLGLFTNAFNLILPSNSNVYQWTVTGSNGAPPIVEIRPYVNPSSDFFNFTHNIPTTEDIEVKHRVTNSTTGLICEVTDRISWEPQFGGAFSAWTKISSGSGVVLPVKLSSFNGEVKQNSISLFWVTESEINNKGFEIQKSLDGIDWEAFDFVKGNGSSNETNQYDTVDPTPNIGVNFYRLKQVDYDGMYAMSEVVQVRYQDTPKNQLDIFPNPSNGLVNIQMNNEDAAFVTIKITDVLGRIVWQDEITGDQKYYSKKVDIAENGLFYLSKTQSNKISVEKIMISGF